MSGGGADSVMLPKEEEGVHFRILRCVNIMLVVNNAARHGPRYHGVLGNVHGAGAEHGNLHRPRTFIRGAFCQHFVGVSTVK